MSIILILSLQDIEIVKHHPTHTHTRHLSTESIFIIKFIYSKLNILQIPIMQCNEI